MKTNDKAAIVAVYKTVLMGLLLWLFWTYCRIGTKYFGFLPINWQAIPINDCVNITCCVAVIRTIIFPRMMIANVTNNVNVDQNECDGCECEGCDCELE